MARTKSTSVSDYIASAPSYARGKLRELRSILKEIAPDATESIKWGSPVLEEKRILFAYSAHKAHLNFMPTRTALEPFRKELVAFKTGKDTIQLPYDKPLPKALIRTIAAFRANDVRKNDALWMGG
jgi:uncharacterized protein YdhG (YjbR/CyaY superfamily)